MPFSPIRQTKRWDLPVSFRSRYASPIITVRTGMSTMVFDFHTASNSMSKIRSLSDGNHSLSAISSEGLMQLSGYVATFNRPHGTMPVFQKLHHDPF